MRIGVGEVGVVGNEGEIGLCLLYNGMATGNNVNGITLIELRAAVVMLRCHLGQTQVDVYLGHGVSSIKNLFCSMNGKVCSQLSKKLAFQFADALLGVEDKRLVFFQVGCNVAFTVGERLFANVVFGHTVGVGIGDLNVVAGTFIIANFEVIDARAPAFALLQIGYPFLPIL